MYDLHCHSTCSDGTMSPQEIVDHAQEIGLEGLAITDHDNIDAYSQVDAGTLKLITGVEFSCFQRDSNVHILAYSFRPNHPRIIELCNRHIDRRQERNLAIITELKRHGMIIDTKRFANAKLPLGRPHIAQEMVEKGYVKTLDDAFRRFIGDDKPCWVAGERISVEETLDIITQSEGLAVIAHPHLIKDRRIVRDLLEMNFDGIEVHYGRFPPSENRPWLKITEDKGWLATGGSDFHGDIKPETRLGSASASEETFNALWDHFNAEL